ncbi:MAG: xanthine dehydrogenase family protein subunit M [Acetobacteraceae bacterium]|nr:xanthine dehydrogenase family protein subunit M [Acetobacteraceae bacterium]
MKAAAFDYVRADSLPEALSLLARHGEDAKLLAGGQSLLPALNLRLSAPGILLDIGRIGALRGVTLRDGVLHIGALTRHADLLASPEVRAHAPLIARAVAHVAHPAIRSRGTIGGSLANADPAAELPACMLALQARLVGESECHGRRVIAAEDFFTGLFATALAPDEILTAVEVDAAGPDDRWGFEELTRRSGDYAIVGLAAHGRARGGVLDELRLGYFSVGTQPTLARIAAVALLGRPVTADAIAEAQTALAGDLEPHDDLQASAATRMELARVLLRRVVGGML